MEKKVAKCGTRSGYNRHKRLDEPYCEECKKANKEYYMGKYRNDPEYRARFLKNQYSRHKERMEEDPEYAEKQKLRFHNIYKEKYKNSEFRKKLLTASNLWSKTNVERRRELGRFHSKKRRALKLGNEHSEYKEQEVLDTYGTDCYLCKEPINLEAPRVAGVDGWEKGLHIDHVIPIIKGGPDTLENVRPSHALCNISKGAKELDEVLLHNLEEKPLPY